MSLKIIPFYTGLLGLLYFFLTVQVVRARRAFRVGLGHGGHEVLERRVAAHLNFAEYTPLVLLILAFLEMNLLPAFYLHGLAIVFLIGRLATAYGVSQTNENFRFRMVGMVLTFLVLLVSSAVLVYATGAWMLAG